MNNSVRQAKDPRDYVYVGLGLIDDDDIVKSRLWPDYRLSPAEVYSTATRAVIELSHSRVSVWCELLQSVTCGTRNDVLALPS